jgi:nitroreductase
VTATAWSTALDGSPGPALRECLEAAVAAPSIHNTQPWRFRLDHGGVDVLADRDRRLSVVDPRGRELLISVGAAVLNLRVAILARGRQALSRIFPSPGEPDLVARVSVGPATHVSETARSLARAIPRRRTNRRPFADVPVPESALAELVAAARAEGVSFAVADAAGRDALLGLVRTADQRWLARPEYWAELAEWTMATMGSGRTDGVPPESYGPWSAAEAVPLRDFGLLQPVRRRRVSRFEKSPMLAVLSVADDSPPSWVRAGQAMERVLLTATVRGLATTPMSQPLEIEELRGLLTDTTDGRVAQVILRIGYGPPCPPTPRRALEEMLVLRPAAPARSAPPSPSGVR